MKGLEDMISKIKKTIAEGKTPREAYEDFQAQGVDGELLHYAMSAALADAQIHRRLNKQK